jgi:hypothetical protein
MFRVSETWATGRDRVFTDIEIAIRCGDRRGFVGGRVVERYEAGIPRWRVTGTDDVQLSRHLRRRLLLVARRRFGGIPDFYGVENLTIPVTDFAAWLEDVLPGAQANEVCNSIRCGLSTRKPTV